MMRPRRLQNSLERWGIWLIITAVMFLLIFFWQHQLRLTGGQIGVPLDDAWIHYQFARNISQGNGFSYNVGQPTPGSTAPLWTVILASIGLFSESFIIPSIILSALLLLLTVWMVFQLSQQLGIDSKWGLLAALGVGLSGRMLWAGLSGMEVTLFSFLSLMAVTFYHQKGMHWQTAVILGLASQVRPEAHLLFLICIVDFAISALFNKKDGGVNLVASSLIIPVLIYGLINLPYMLFSMSVTGRPLPNTFYAKSDNSQFFSIRTLRELIRIHFRDNALLFVMMPFGLYTLWQKSSVACLWLMGLLSVTPIVVPFLWHHGRYTMPLIPFMMLAGALGIAWVVQKVSKPQPFVIVILCLVILSGGVRLPYWADMLGNNTREIIEIDVAIGQWLAENTAPSAIIAVDDIGAIGYLSGREIFDLNGLISPEVWPVLNGTEQGIPRDAAMTRVLAEGSPDYLAIFPEWHWNIATNPQIVRETAVFTTDTQTIIGGKRAVVYDIEGWPFLKIATPQFTTQIRYGESIMLKGYDLSIDDHIHLTLYWANNQPVQQSYDVFIHIYNSQGDIVSQADSIPLNTLLPTTVWQSDDKIKDSYQLQLPAELPGGEYEIAIGLFHRPSGVRLPATSELINRADAVVITTFMR